MIEWRRLVTNGLANYLIGVPMNWSRQSKRAALALVTLSLGACQAGHHFAESRGWKIEDQAEARNACLARGAEAFATDNSDASSSAQAVALACKPQTDKLIVLMNQSWDPKVAAAMEKDAEFRAVGYILKARGQGEN